MTTKTLCRIVVALGTLCACLALTSSPASAGSHFHTVDFTAGTLAITNGSIPLAKGGLNCVGNMALLENDKAPSKMKVADFYVKNRFTVSTSATVYVAKVTFKAGGAAGDINSPGAGAHNTTDSSVKLVVNVWAAANQGGTSCDTTGGVLCTWEATNALTMAWTGSLPLSNTNLTVPSPTAFSLYSVDAGCPSALTPPLNVGVQYFSLAGLNVVMSDFFNIDDGTMTFAKTGSPTVVASLDPFDDDGCQSSLAMNLTTTTIAVTSVVGQTLFTVAGTSYVMMITRSSTGNTTGAVSGTAVTGLGVGLQMTLYARASDTPCTPTGTVICTLRAASTYSGTVTGTTPPLTGVLSATGATVTAGGPCGVPFSTYIGSILTTSGLAFELV